MQAYKLKGQSCFQHEHIHLHRTPGQGHGPRQEAARAEVARRSDRHFCICFDLGHQWSDQGTNRREHRPCRSRPGGRLVLAGDWRWRVARRPWECLARRSSELGDGARCRRTWPALCTLCATGRCHGRACGAGCPSNSGSTCRCTLIATMHEHLHVEINDPVHCTIYAGANPGRPEPHAQQAIECPQCGKSTWRHSHNCMWCGFNRWGRIYQMSAFGGILAICVLLALQFTR